MKGMIFVLVIGLVCLAGPSFGQSFAELEVYSSASEVSPKVIGYQAKNLSNSNFGLFSFCWVEKVWAEGYGGLTYAPVDWLQLGLGVGLEQAGNPWRAASSIWTGNDQVS